MTIDLLAAAAGAGAAGAPPAWISFLPIVGMIAIFWFLIISPQMKRQKEHQAKIAGVKKGDQVVKRGLSQRSRNVLPCSNVKMET